MLPLLFLFSAMMAGPALAILEHLAAARWLGFAPRMDLLARLARIEAWLVALCLAFQIGDLFYRGAAGAMLSATWFALSFWVEIGLRPARFPSCCCCMPEVRESRRDSATACSLVVAGVLLHRLNVAVIGLRVRHWETLRPVAGRDRHHAGHHGGRGVRVRRAGAHPAHPRRAAAAGQRAHRSQRQPGALRGADGIA